MMPKSGTGNGLPAPNITVPPVLGETPTSSSRYSPHLAPSPVSSHQAVHTFYSHNQMRPSQSSGSSFSVLSNHTGHTSNGFVHVPMSMNGPSPAPTMSYTDVSLEQAMEKVQELAQENATLRGNHHFCD